MSWACLNCTFLNDETTSPSRCAICDGVRQVKPRTPSVTSSASSSASSASSSPTSTSTSSSSSSSSSLTGWPVRAYIQKFDSIPPDYALVAEELKRRSIPVVYKRTEEIMGRRWQPPPTRHDLIVGNFDWTRLACEQLGITMPNPPDYPECLKHLLHRRVWQSTLGGVRAFLKAPENKSTSVFLKPAATAKAFAAIVEPRDQMLDMLIDGIPGAIKGLPASTPVLCSELVDMIVEYRVYVVDGVIRSICQYRGPKTPVPSADSADDSSSGSTDAILDMSVVKEAVRLLSESAECRDLTGYGMDFAVIKTKKKAETSGEVVEVYVTCLVEVNDGYSLGRYEGLSGKDYTDLLIARWARLVGTTKS